MKIIPDVSEATYKSICAMVEAYDKGDADYSCTELNDPAQITLLKQRHYDEIEVLASSRLKMWLGSLGHLALEKAGVDNAITEERLFHTINGRKISGASDVANWILTGDGTITDYKFTNVWTIIHGSRIPEWTAQQNIYRYLYEQHGFVIDKLKITAFCVDWRNSEARQRGKDYPPIESEFEVDLWSMEKTREYIMERLDILKSCEDLLDNELPHCTEEEMWTKPSVWAVKKKGNKTAMRGGANFGNEQSAREFIGQQKHPCEIEFRPGSRNRCGSPPVGYCDVSPFCSQWTQYQEDINAKD